MTPQVASFAAVLGLDPAELVKQLDVEALVKHCDGSAEAALDTWLNNQALCREVAPPKAQGIFSSRQLDPTALLVAAQQGDLAQVRELVAAGTAVGNTPQFRYDNTPLIIAAEVRCVLSNKKSTFAEPTN